MYRSASSTRVSEDYFNYNTSPPKVSPAMRALSLESSELPLYEQFSSSSSEVAKKDKSRLKFGENGVHLIPFVLILCAFILWFFSNPGTTLLFIFCPCLFLRGLNTEVWILAKFEYFQPFKFEWQKYKLHILVKLFVLVKN